MGSESQSLPPVIARAVEAVRVAPAVRALARRLGPISLDVHLSQSGALPPGLAQLIKLAVLEAEAFPITFDTSLADAWVLARRGAFEERIDDVALRGRLEDLLVPLLSALVPPDQLVRQVLTLLHEIEDLTRYDHGTGIYNRKELELRFSQERARAQRAGTPLSFLLVGLDDLPPGHRGGEPGDTLLRNAGSLLREELRALDVAARFDDSELAVVLPGAGSLEAAHVARRLGVSALSRGLALSIGLAVFPEDCDHPDDLVRLSGIHLSTARDAGGGRACLSEDGDPIIFAQEA